MAVRITSASFFRRGSVRLLLCAALLCAALFAANRPVLAMVPCLLIVALAGALRRLQDQKSVTPLRSRTETPPALQGGRPGTGLANRQALEQKLQAESARDKRPDDPTALLLISVDAFSQLHEQASTIAAEVAMLTLSCALQRMLPREADMLARYDDSTFAVVLSGTDLPGSLRVAARLRWAIVRLGIANPRTASGFLTVSMSIVVQHHLGSENVAALLLTAGSVLEKAQRSGHDSLDYLVLGGESSAAPIASQIPALVLPASRALPAIRAWTPDQAEVVYSPQS